MLLALFCTANVLICDRLCNRQWWPSTYFHCFPLLSCLLTALRIGFYLCTQLPPQRYWFFSESTSGHGQDTTVAMIGTNKLRGSGPSSPPSHYWHLWGWGIIIDGRKGEALARDRSAVLQPWCACVKARTHVTQSVILVSVDLLWFLPFSSLFVQHTLSSYYVHKRCSGMLAKGKMLRTHCSIYKNGPVFMHHCWSYLCSHHRLVRYSHD